MNKNYKGKIEEAEFNDCIKSYLLNSDDDERFEAVEASIEMSDQYDSLKIDEVKEKQIIQKLREKGIRGIGLAGQSLVAVVLIGLNMM